tara:strand:+ start:1818 stop:2078 length:261 start_codon:yes stop_codon:yes gene_type:complete
MEDNKKFFVVEKTKYNHMPTRYEIHQNKMYDLTQAIKVILALDTLNEDRKKTSYHLQEVNFSEVDKNQEPLILTDEVKEDKQQMLF